MSISVDVQLTTKSSVCFDAGGFRQVWKTTGATYLAVRRASACDTFRGDFVDPLLGHRYRGCQLNALAWPSRWMFQWNGNLRAEE